MGIDELCALFGLTRRQIRFYRETRLIPPPRGFGRWATYDNEHVRRLRDIQRAKDARVTLADLRERFAARG